jgi:cyanophycinase
MTIKGTLIAIGGNEDKGTGRKPLHVRDTPHDFVTSGILYRVATEVKDPTAPLEIVTTASSIPEKVGPAYQRAFRKLGRNSVGTLHLTSPAEADAPLVWERLRRAGGILFSGGDQAKLTAVLRGTALIAHLHARYLHEPVVIAGTSAGAMALSDLMLYPADPGQHEADTDVVLQSGLELIHDVLFDTHFLVRGRFRRLAVAVANRPSHLGIGLEEDTGIVIRGGNQIETIGSGLVTIIDGRSLRESNRTVQRDDHEIFVENLLVHLLSHGDHFTLRKLKIA